MTRTYAASVNSYLSEPVIEFRILADVAFVNTTMRLHTGVGSLMIGATHYDGVGRFGGIEKVEEAMDTFNQPMRLWLSALDATALADAAQENLFGRSVTLQRCWLNNGTLVNTPELWYRGQISEVNIIRGDAERGNYIECMVQTKLARNHRGQFYTKEDLWMTYSGDTFFNFLHLIENQKARWGDQPTTFNSKRYNRHKKFRQSAWVGG